MRVEVLDRRHLTEVEALPVAKLLVKVFPRRPLEDRLALFVSQYRDYDGPEEFYPRSMIIRDGERVVAHAAVPPRTIGTSEGDFKIAALALVATDPDYRGQRLGQAVVRAVFDLVDHGPYAYSLFQTSHKVRPFYEKLGAGLVTNRIVNSLADEPTANPFWDEVVMRYPAAKHWPEGEIDLRGPGF
jgi:predicted N-acetyltransferase YhbS